MQNSLDHYVKRQWDYFKETCLESKLLFRYLDKNEMRQHQFSAVSCEILKIHRERKILGVLQLIVNLLEGLVAQRLTS